MAKMAVWHPKGMAPERAKVAPESHETNLFLA